MEKKIAIYPGTFDPVTNGHIDIAARALDIFDEVIIAVLVNQKKTPLFSVEERVALIQDSCAHLKNITVEAYDGLLVEYLRKKNCSVVLRGLRAVTDLEYEFQLATINNMMDPGIETVFLMPASNYTFLTSSVVREAYGAGGELLNCVPENVHKALKQKFK